MKPRHSVESYHPASARPMKDYGPLFNLSGETCAGSRKACRKTSATHIGSETQADQPAQSSGEVLRDKGIEQVKSHNESWMDDAYEWAVRFVSKPPVGFNAGFTGEDIRFFIEGLVDPPKHPNAWGALIKTLIKRKVIRATGKYRQPRDKSSHARSIQVYEAA